MSRHTDLNGDDVIEYKTGTWNEDHTGFIGETTKIVYTTYKSAAGINIDNSTRAGEPNYSFKNTRYTPNSYQMGVYKSMDQASKAAAILLAGAVSLPSLAEAFPATAANVFIYGPIEELAGLPNPEGMIEKTMVKDAANSYLSKKLEHAFANGRLNYLGSNVGAVKQKAISLANSYKPLLKNGDNTIIGNINGQATSIKAFVKDGEISNMNIYPGVSNRATDGPVINFGNQTW